MCKLENLKVGNKIIKVADIKRDYIQNIIDSAHSCKEIDKIVLFGSVLEERCTDESDIDIAVFGKIQKAKLYRSKNYNRFVDSVVSFGELRDYDIIYIDSKKIYDDEIMNDINKGVVLFERMW